MVFDYVDGGADAENTLRSNVSVFDEVLFRPRGAVVSPRASLETTVLGQRFSLPFLLAPIGSTRLLFPKGEVEAARAAAAAGTGYILSTLAGTSLEEVKAGSTGTCWYQVYLVGGREVASAAIERARKAGYGALVLTVDTAISGLRERDYRNGIAQLVAANPFRKLPYVWQILSRPGWLFGYLADGGLMRFPNVVLPDGPMRYAAVAAALEQSVVSWADLKWIRELWKGPIVIKGILTAEDGERAVDEGVAAVVVSNHGGRQLDGVFPALRALPEVVGAVRGRIDVLMDGGIRRGSDIVKALVLGARAVLVGRAYAYGLGAAGAAGVTRGDRDPHRRPEPDAAAPWLLDAGRPRPLDDRAARRLRPRAQAARRACRGASVGRRGPGAGRRRPLSLAGRRDAVDGAPGSGMLHP